MTFEVAGYLAGLKTTGATLVNNYFAGGTGPFVATVGANMTTIELPSAGHPANGNWVLAACSKVRVSSEHFDGVLSTRTGGL